MPIIIIALQPLTIPPCFAALPGDVAGPSRSQERQLLGTDALCGWQQVARHKVPCSVWHRQREYAATDRAEDATGANAARRGISAHGGTLVLYSRRDLSFCCLYICSMMSLL